VDLMPRAQTSLGGARHHLPSSAQSVTLATMTGPPIRVAATLTSVAMDSTTVPLQTTFAQTQMGVSGATLAQSQGSAGMGAVAPCKAVVTPAATATASTNSGTLRSQLDTMFS